MPDPVTIAFCASCTAILSEHAPDNCENCDHSVTDRKNRAEGIFPAEDAQKLRNPEAYWTP